MRRKTLLLTGASRGIGHATVRRFNAEGWRVITCSRQPFPKECPWGGGEENHVQLDLSDPSDTINAVGVIQERLEGGKLDALVNNAGVLKAVPIAEAADDDYDAHFETNPRGTFNTLREAASRLEDGVKAVLTPGMLFEALGFRYIGPTDGHDVVKLATRLKEIRQLGGPILLHTLTVKGKGFAPAEADQVKWHAQSSPFDKLTGKSLASPTPSGTKPPKWQDVFGDAIIELAEQDPRVVGVTAAMPSGTSLGKMMEAMPNRAFDVGIAEMHAVVFAAGLATQGMRPFAAIYSTFLQRAYDGVVHDVALQNLPVTFCMDRAGVAGADGPTHHGALDIAFMRAVQGLVCAAPLDEQDLRDLLYTSLQHDGPFAVRYPRGQATGMALREGFRQLEIGKGRQLQAGTFLFLQFCR